jgi:hypothetical protein
MLLFHLLSFARFNWKSHNKFAAVGSAILGFTSFGLAFIFIFFGNYEL